MHLVFLGTSSMVPTKERNPSTVFLSYKTEGILFDCGEGTQRQMNIFGIKRTKVTRILLSHWHGDHVGGLLGLLQTVGNKEVNPHIYLYGPEGTKKRMEHLMKSIVFDVQLDLVITELVPQSVETFFENEDFILQCAPMEHRTPCVAYSFIEKDKISINSAYLKEHGIKEGPHLKKLQAGKSIIYEGKKISVEQATTTKQGKKITYLTDSVKCTMCVEISHEADIFICEATYDNDLQNKAIEYMHLTARDAAQIANLAHVKQLILTHFSQRYKTTGEVLDDAKDYFPNVVAAYDFMKVEV